MKTNTQRKESVKRKCDGNGPKMKLPRKLEKNLYEGYDDFLYRLTTLKQRGELVISGIRIC